jgi:histidine triad (HIT) family protein
MSEACLFCKIVQKEIDAEILYEDDSVTAFRDVNPQAPVHVLIVPKTHIATVNDFRAEHRELLSQLMLAASKIARDQGVEEDGYRLVLNCQEGAGQSVFHVHMHLLGGRRMSWPPG